MCQSKLPTISFTRYISSRWSRDLDRFLGTKTDFHVILSWRKRTKHRMRMEKAREIHETTWLGIPIAASKLSLAGVRGFFFSNARKFACNFMFSCSDHAIFLIRLHHVVLKGKSCMAHMINKLHGNKLQQSITNIFFC